MRTANNDNNDNTGSVSVADVTPFCDDRHKNNLPQSGFSVNRELN
jgi:hypothetical protein